MDNFFIITTKYNQAKHVSITTSIKSQQLYTRSQQKQTTTVKTNSKPLVSRETEGTSINTITPNDCVSRETEKQNKCSKILKIVPRETIFLIKGNFFGLIKQMFHVKQGKL